MDLRRDEIDRLIKEIEEKKKQITTRHIKKYVFRNTSHKTDRKNMILDIQRIVNKKFNTVEMLEKYDALAVLQKHIEYLDGISGGLVDRLLLKPYDYLYYLVNAVLLILSIALIINVFYLVPYYAHSDSKILKIFNSRNLSASNKKLEDFNARNISIAKTEVISNLNKFKKQIQLFTEDFFKEIEKKEKRLSNLEIKRLIVKHFSNIQIRKNIFQSFINNDKRNRQGYINYLKNTYYLKYPKYKYLAIDNHLEDLIKQNIISGVNYSRINNDMYATINNYIQIFKEKDILNTIEPYNIIKSKSILNYTPTGFILGVIFEANEKSVLKENLLNKLSYKIFNGTKDNIGIVYQLKKLQLQPFSKS